MDRKKFIPWAWFCWPCSAATDRLWVLDVAEVNVETKIRIIGLSRTKLKVAGRDDC
jgi:hypothetical protein